MSLNMFKFTSYSTFLYVKFTLPKHLPVMIDIIMDFLFLTAYQLSWVI